MKLFKFFMACFAIGSFHDNILAESKRTILVPPVLLTSWQDAFVICHSFDYEVISFLTQDDIKSFNQYVIDHGLTNSTFWTDFRRIGGTWISQEKGYGMGETNWASGQPDNAGGNQGCVSINPAAQKWYDNNCANMYSVACVKDENKCCNKIDPCKKPC